MYIFSSQRGGIYFSPQAARLFGCSLEYLCDHPFLWTQSIHPDDLPGVIEAIQQFEDGKNFSVEYRMQDTRGQWHWLLDRSIGRRQEHDEMLIEGLATDITERRQAEERLRQSEENLKKAQQVAHVGSWQWQIKTNQLTWSDEMYHIFGIRKDEFTGSLGDVLMCAIHPDDLPAVEYSNNSVINNKKPIPLEYRDLLE